MLLLVTLGCSAFADSFVSDRWTATFNGSKITDNFSASEISEAISGIEPGDSLTVKIKLNNASSGKTAWYMTNDVLQSLEESLASPSGGAYSYNLTYTDPSGVPRTLFDSKVSGGEKGDLQETTAGLGDYMFLGEIESGRTGTVALTMALNGESEGNVYMDADALLQMNFAVDTNTSTLNKFYAAKTADRLDMYTWSAVLVLSAAAVLYLTAVRRKSRGDKA